MDLSPVLRPRRSGAWPARWPRPVVARLVALSTALTLAACAAPPGVAIPVPAAEASGPPPDLVPLSPLLAAAAAQQDSARTSPDAASALDARAASLRARAATLRGDVVPAPLRGRLDAGVPRAALP